MKSVYFFALKEDLLAILELIESKGPVQYALTGNFRRDEVVNGITVFRNGAEISNLGQAVGDSSTLCDAYLVCESTASIALRNFHGNDGERTCVDQLANADSVVLLPGGSWGDAIILRGNIGTASDSPVSQALMKRFQAAIKKSFKKVKAFYVGPSAMARLETGARLTASARSPREYDLTLA